MPEIKKPKSGEFCWVELASSDPVAGRAFYQKLLGWNFTDMPMPEPYAIADLGGKHVAGVMRLPEQAKAMGAPPHWLSYVAVEDAKAAAAQATALGGTVVFGPATMGPGTFAVIQDPAGGTFALWQAPAEPMGTFLYGETGALCWNELISTDLDRAGRFYSGLFGWKLESAPMPGMEYTIIKKGDQQVGGMMAQPQEMAGAPSLWNAYFAVADCDGTVAKAIALGGRPVVPAMDIPEVGRIAMLADPQGAAFSVLKPAQA